MLCILIDLTSLQPLKPEFKSCTAYPRLENVLEVFIYTIRTFCEGGNRQTSHVLSAGDLLDQFTLQPGFTVCTRFPGFHTALDAYMRVSRAY